VSAPRVHVAPSLEWAELAVRAGGGDVAAASHGLDGVIWCGDEPGQLELLLENTGTSWVQLTSTGVDAYLHLIDDCRLWTCARGAFAEPVAELALGMMLALRRRLVSYARRDRWSDREGQTLHRASVTVIGGGGIARSLLRLLGPFNCATAVVNTTGSEVNGADHTYPASELKLAVTGVDVVVVACPLTPSTVGVVNADLLAVLSPGAVVINVGRGAHVVTADLLSALDSGHVGGAGLDVTDPEPLVDGHPLWCRDNVIITPHTGNTADMIPPLVGPLVSENVRRLRHGEDLLGVVDQIGGY
jgi:phosphoglycerate dehydrogenase-like enzyme